MDRHYPVLYARRLTNQFRPTVLLTLQAEENINIKIYLPRRHAEGFDDQDIEDTNEGGKLINVVAWPQFYPHIEHHAMQQTFPLWDLLGVPVSDSLYQHYQIHIPIES